LSVTRTSDRSLIGESATLDRVDRSFQTAARAKETGTLAEPACPLGGIASDASATRPEGDIASDVSRPEPDLFVSTVTEGLVLGLAAAAERRPRELLRAISLHDSDRAAHEQRPVRHRRHLELARGRASSDPYAPKTERRGRAALHRSLDLVHARLLQVDPRAAAGIEHAGQRLDAVPRVETESGMPFDDDLVGGVFARSQTLRRTHLPTATLPDQSRPPFPLDARQLICKARFVKSCEPSGPRDLAFVGVVFSFVGVVFSG
jgi:hypothetical protein